MTYQYVDMIQGARFVESLEPRGDNTYVVNFIGGEWAVIHKSRILEVTL